MIIPARLRWLWLTLTVVLAHRASKAWFESQTVEGWHHELIPNFIYLVHSRNPGIAFGVFADSAITIGAALIIIDVLFFHKHHAPEVTNRQAS